MRVKHFLLYQFDCSIGGEDVVYIGITGVWETCSDLSAMAQRNKWHIEKPVKCLEEADPDSMQMSLLNTNLPKDRALVDEALQFI